MSIWRIAWTQRNVAGKRRYVDRIEAPTLRDALAIWGKMSWCNARLDAIWDESKFDRVSVFDQPNYKENA